MAQWLPEKISSIPGAYKVERKKMAPISCPLSYLYTHNKRTKMYYNFKLNKQFSMLSWKKKIKAPNKSTQIKQEGNKIICKRLKFLEFIGHASREGRPRDLGGLIHTRRCPQENSALLCRRPPSAMDSFVSQL